MNNLPSASTTATSSVALNKPEVYFSCSSVFVPALCKFLINSMLNGSSLSSQAICIKSKFPKSFVHRQYEASFFLIISFARIVVVAAPPIDYSISLHHPQGYSLNAQNAPVHQFVLGYPALHYAWYVDQSVITRPNSCKLLNLQYCI